MFGVRYSVVHRDPWLVGVSLMVACALLAPGGTHAETGGPVETAVTFIEASQAWRCDEVWRLFSAGTRENFLAAEHRYEREREGAPHADPPEKHFCGFTWHTFKRGTARLVRQDGDTTIVAVDFLARLSRYRYDFFPPTTTVTEELQLIREDGAWRVERPRLPIGREGWRLVEVGRVDVFQTPNPGPGMHRRLEATVLSRVAPKTLATTFRDPKSWALVLPSIGAAQAIERTADAERVQLTFATEPERSLTVDVKTFGTPGDPSSERALNWIVEGGDEAPVYVRGWWRITPHHDGARIKLELVVDPRHWSGDVTEGDLSAERMAQAVLGLEKAARESAP